MAHITHKGNPVQTSGSLPALGTLAPDFVLTRGDLSDATLASWEGKIKVFNIVPSLDTGVCALSTERFNKEAANLPGVVIAAVSRDLPFAQTRFCKASNLQSIETLSEMRNRAFGPAWGCDIIDGKLAGVLSRAVVVLDRNNKVVYTEQVPEIAQEPNYEAALKAIKALL